MTLRQLMIVRAGVACGTSLSGLWLADDLGWMPMRHDHAALVCMILAFALSLCAQWIVLGVKPR